MCPQAGYRHRAFHSRGCVEPNRYPTTPLQKQKQVQDDHPTYKKRTPARHICAPHQRVQFGLCRTVVVRKQKFPGDCTSACTIIGDCSAIV